MRVQVSVKCEQTITDSAWRWEWSTNRATDVGITVSFTDVGPGISVWFHPTANDSINHYIHLVSVLCIPVTIPISPTFF